MRMHEVLGVNAASRAAATKKKELDHVSIHPAENGGHLVEHHFSHGDGPYREPKQHVFGKDEHAEMLAHVANALKLPEPKDEEGKQDSKGSKKQQAGEQEHAELEHEEEDE